MAICKSAIAKLGPSNVVLIFTHCDQDQEMDINYAQEWYSIGMTNNEGLPAIPNERIFLFKGKNGQGGVMTTTDEI